MNEGNKIISGFGQEEERMDSEKNILNKSVSVFFDDGDKVTRKDGFVESVNGQVLFLNVDHENEQLIPFDRIVRIELKNEKQTGET